MIDPDAISFDDLTNVPRATLTAHMRDPRVTRHLPLLAEPWSDRMTDQFLATKTACWQRDGLGHWAFRLKGLYVGWGGFQKEGDDWDYGLVLTHDGFGLGLPITHKALAFARNDPRIPYVTFLLPPSRRHFGALRRFGAQALEPVLHDGQSFLKFRVETT
ncbi:MAG: GNAT family N-acetyltransferase [Rhodobacteraceae bacterium]|nr:GNAT family N-acetyltransferase [Paracoccaceae bacterium]